MKTLEIQVPEGYEIDKKNSTFEQIVFKKIEKKLPLSVDEINHRPYYINNEGYINEYFGHTHKQGIQNVSTKERAEAFLALMQLIELRDAWNGDWKPDWTNGSLKKYTIEVVRRKISKTSLCYTHKVLNFKSVKLRDKFLEQFEHLIETAKELL